MIDFTGKTLWVIKNILLDYLADSFRTPASKFLAGENNARVLGGDKILYC